MGTTNDRPQASDSISHASSGDDPQVAKLQLEVEFLRHQNEKLSIEVADLRSEGAAAKAIKRFLPIATGLIAVGGFWFGIFQYTRAESASRDQRRDSESERIKQQDRAAASALQDLKRETAKPFWEAQLRLYLEASEKAAIIATTDDDQERKAATNRFWVIYWGPLASVEDVGLTKKTSGEIEAAMVNFGREMHNGKSEKLQQLSLDLAHAIREAVAPAFDLQATKSQGLRLKKP